MAQRIPIIVCQSSSGRPARKHLEEELITRLLLEPGFDATVISDLDTLQQHETSLLCLEGISSDMILLSWNRPEAAVAKLNAIDIEGRQGRTSFDQEPSAAGRQSAQAARENSDDRAATTNSRRTIFAIDFAVSDNPDIFLQELQRLVAEATIQTVDLVDLQAGKRIVVQSTPVPQPQTAERPDGPLDENDSQSMDLQIDQLMDDFDSMDL